MDVVGMVSEGMGRPSKAMLQEMGVEGDEGGRGGQRGNGVHMSAQGTAYVCMTSIQGETTHNAHTGPGREEVGGHTMRAVYTQYEGGVLGPQGLHAGRRERQKATRTHAQHMLARHRHTSQHGCTWPHKKREAGGCSGRGTGGLGAGHTDMNAWLFPLSHMCTREQHTALPITTKSVQAPDTNPLQTTFKPPRMNILN